MSELSRKTPPWLEQLQGGRASRSLGSTATSRRWRTSPRGSRAPAAPPRGVRARPPAAPARRGRAARHRRDPELGLRRRRSCRPRAARRAISRRRLVGSTVGAIGCVRTRAHSHSIYHIRSAGGIDASGGIDSTSDAAASGRATSTPLGGRQRNTRRSRERTCDIDAPGRASTQHETLPRTDVRHRRPSPAQRISFRISCTIVSSPRSGGAPRPGGARRRRRSSRWCKAAGSAGARCGGSAPLRCPPRRRPPRCSTAGTGRTPRLNHGTAVPRAEQLLARMARPEAPCLDERRELGVAPLVGEDDPLTHGRRQRDALVEHPLVPLEPRSSSAQLRVGARRRSTPPAPAPRSSCPPSRGRRRRGGGRRSRSGCRRRGRRRSAAASRGAARRRSAPSARRSSGERGRKSGRSCRAGGRRCRRPSRWGWSDAQIALAAAAEGRHHGVERQGGGDVVGLGAQACGDARERLTPALAGEVARGVSLGKSGVHGG